MSGAIDLNALTQQSAEDLHNVLQQTQQMLVGAQAAFASINQQAQKIGPILDTLQAVLKEAVTVETDVDGVVKTVHLKWPL